MSWLAILSASTAVVLAAGLDPWMPVIFALVIVINAIVSIRKAKRQREEHLAQERTEIEGQRTHEVRERMRRLQEERRRATQGHVEQPEPQPLHVPVESTPSPPARGRGVPPVDPFGNSPWKRLVEELEKKMQPPPAPPPVVTRREFVPEPPRRLPDPVALRRALEEPQEGPARPMPTPHRSTTPVRSAPHPLLRELRQPESMRRAIVLREVLGPPVALR